MSRRYNAAGGQRRSKTVKNFLPPLSRMDMKEVMLILRARQEVGNDLVDRFLKDFPDVEFTEETLKQLHEVKAMLK